MNLRARELDELDLGVMLAVEREIAEKLEFAVGFDVQIFGEDPETHVPQNVLDAFAQDMAVVKVQGPAGFLIPLLENLLRAAKLRFTEEQAAAAMRLEEIS